MLDHLDGCPMFAKAYMDGWPISRSFFARYGIPPMLTAKCVGRIKSQRERAVVSHISRKTSEIWATRPSSGNEKHSGAGLSSEVEFSHRLLAPHNLQQFTLRANRNSLLRELARSIIP